MAEYIEREAVRNALYDADAITMKGVAILNQFPAADVVEVSEMKEFAEDVVYQFGYKINCADGRLYLSSGGLSTLEWAFSILGWPDPKSFPEGECEWDGCHEYASCGTPTSDGYKRVCGKHFAIIKARKEAEAAARMDGDKDAH